MYFHCALQIQVEGEISYICLCDFSLPQLKTEILLPYHAKTALVGQDRAIAISWIQKILITKTKLDSLDFFFTHSISSSPLLRPQRHSWDQYRHELKDPDLFLSPYASDVTTQFIKHKPRPSYLRLAYGGPKSRPSQDHLL